MNTEKPQLVRLEHPEITRTYHYPTHARTIQNVVAVCVRPSGTHRLETVDGRKWIIAVGWEAIEINTKDWSF